MDEDEALNSGSDTVRRHLMITRAFPFPLTRYTSGDPMEGENRSYYSKTIVFLDLIWNLAFVVVSVIVLFLAFNERPSTPLRLWVSGYALQCVLHVGFVYLQYRRNINGLSPSQTNTSTVKRLESINTMVSCIWWIIGFYWIVVGGQALLQDSPRLYWLTVVFLAFDVSFIFFCIGMACIFIFAIFCCIPIVAIAYAVATRQGASEDDIRSLPKYTYRLASTLRTLDNGEKQDVFETGVVESSDKNSCNELILYPEDSDCCICLSHYVDGVELYTLPCNHHFHCGCISRWLQINATCPLCKFNIREGDTLV